MRRVRNDAFTGCSRKLKRDIKTFNFWCLVLFFIGMGIYLICMPKFSDDYWYLMRFKPWFDAQGIADPQTGGNIFTAGVPWKEMWQTWINHYETDNIRLCNMVVPFFLLLPKWVGSGLAVLALIYALMSGLRFIGVDWRKSALIPISLILIWYLLPWGDHMTVTVFQFNYVISIGLAMALITVLGKKRKQGIDILQVFLFGFVVGAWQEGTGLPLLAGLMATCIFKKGKRNAKMYAACVGLALGTGCLLLSPGLWLRIAGASDGERPGMGLYIWYICKWAFYLAAQIPAVILIIKRRGKKPLDYQFILIEFLCLTSMLMNIMLERSARVGFAGMFFTVLLILYLLRQFNGRYWDRNKPVNMILTVPLLLLVFCSQILVCKMVFEMGAEIPEQYARLQKWKNEPVFYNSFPVEEFPLICVDMPDERYHLESRDYMMWYIKGDSKVVTPMFVPEELRNITDTDGEALAGGEGFRRYKYYIYVPAEKFDNKNKQGVKVDFGKGWTVMGVICREFESAANHKRYYYIYPYASFYVRRFKTAKGMRALEP